MSLPVNDQEKAYIKSLIDRGEPLPPKYKAILFIKPSQKKAFLVKDRGFPIPKKSVFNKVVGDSQFELEFASFLDGCEDLISLAKNHQNQGFAIEYHNADERIARYYPDWFVKETEDLIWLIETKEREDVMIPENGAA